MRGQLPSDVAKAKAAMEAKKENSAATDSAADSAANKAKSVDEHAAIAAHLNQQRAANDETQEPANANKTVARAAPTLQLSLEEEPEPDPDELDNEDDGPQFGMNKIG